MANIACVDLFCGAGGLTRGLQNMGVDVVAGVDVDRACKHPFEVNNDAEFLLEDVSELAPEKLMEHFGNASVRVLAGCAPCQPFSTYSHRYDTVGTPRWGLMYHFARLVKNTRPEFVTMENVPTVIKHDVYKDFVRTLVNLGYNVSSGVVDCTKYGLPQTRRRTVLLASLERTINLIAPPENAIRTVRDAIASMERLEQGQSSAGDPLHTAASLSQLNLARIRSSKPGGTWRDWPPELVAACHRKESGRTYPGVYGRMVWDAPSPTMTTQFFGFGNGRFGHPEQDRAITLREGAILQGFPQEYAFVPEGSPIHFKTLGRMIGNAVPVTLGEIIGQSILASLDETTKPMDREADHETEPGYGETLVA